jgi:DNA polymerase III alpha subunit (gram-positive type)
MSLVYFDLETAGLTEAHPDIQIAAIAVDDRGEELEAFERKILFDVGAADPEALKMNHYDAAVWERDAVVHAIAVGDFCSFLKRHASFQMTSKHSGNIYSVARLAGYNAVTFDGPRLKAMFARWGMFLPAHPQILCVLQRAQWWFHENPHSPRPKSMKLGDVCRHFGIAIDGAHDALADVRATAALARRLASPRDQEASCA